MDGKLIAKGSNLCVFLNDELIYEANDLPLSGTSTKIIAIGYNDTSEGRFDNFKFWYLDGVDF
jgi:hypothetical protein